MSSSKWFVGLISSLSKPYNLFCFLFAFRFQYPIKDAALLIKSGIVLAFIITLFFLQSIPMLQRLSIGWCSLIGIIFLLIIAEK